MKNHIYLILYLISINFYSQSIKGYVLDKLTKEPLESVSVYFNNTTLGVITNENGYFTIEKSKNKF